MTGVPVVLTLHNAGLRSYPRVLSKFVAKNVDVVISAHPELTDIVKSFGVANVFQIPNLIDMGTFCSVSPLDIDRLKDELGLADEKIVTYIGRLAEWKDPLTFVESVPHVVKEREDIRFVLVGDGPLLEESKATARKLEVEDFIRIAGPRDDVNVFLSISAIFTALSTLENIWSTTIIEAMIAGVPCIVTKAGYTERVLTHNTNAFLIPPGDENELARAIIQLIDEEETRQRLSENGKLLIDRWGFSKEKVVERTLQLYENLLGTSK
jgi:glycosyltransferase involved in cell wall biosynthesis